MADYLSQGLGLTPRADSKKMGSSPMVEIGPRGLPVIRCAPDAPATRMSAEELVKLEQETLLQEDMKRAGITL